ncbi:hypothetical protein HZB89_00995 [archaeon]|nr:hypothetical protein [archaeon]
MKQRDKKDLKKRLRKLNDKFQPLPEVKKRVEAMPMLHAISMAGEKFKLRETVSGKRGGQLPERQQWIKLKAREGLVTANFSPDANSFRVVSNGTEKAKALVGRMAYYEFIPHEVKKQIRGAVDAKVKEIGWQPSKIIIEIKGDLKSGRYSFEVKPTLRTTIAKAGQESLIAGGKTVKAIGHAGKTVAKTVAHSGWKAAKAGAKGAWNGARLAGKGVKKLDSLIDKRNAEAKKLRKLRQKFMPKEVKKEEKKKGLIAWLKSLSLGRLAGLGAIGGAVGFALAISYASSTIAQRVSGPVEAAVQSPAMVYETVSGMPGVFFNNPSMLLLVVVGLILFFFSKNKEQA